MNSFSFFYNQSLSVNVTLFLGMKYLRKRKEVNLISTLN